MLLEIRAGFVASVMGMEGEGPWAVVVFQNNSPLAQEVGTLLEDFFLPWLKFSPPLQLMKYNGEYQFPVLIFLKETL